MNKKHLSLIVLAAVTAGLYVARTPETTHYTNAEHVPETEQRDLQELIDIAFIRYDRIRDKNDATYRRDQHSKGHGCVKARFEVLPDIPEELRIGLFNPTDKPRGYDAWIRFSNAAFGMDPDRAKDGRGMSLKLLDVPGPKLMKANNESNSQDFVMMNHPVFLIRDVADYLLMGQLGEAQGDQRMRFFFPTWNPFDWRIKDGLTALAILSYPPNSPVDTDYFSVSAYKLGNDKYVKYAMKRCAETGNKNNYGDDDDLMRKNLKDVLATNAVCYSFMLQPQSNQHYMPVEDLTVKWSENDSPFVPVAKVLIEKQQFDTPNQNEFCENMSFNPWHALPEHQPVGGLNRARKVVYETITNYRHEKNGVVDAERDSRYGPRITANKD